MTTITNLTELSTTPGENDVVPIVNLAAPVGSRTKKTKWSTLKAALKTVNDLLYAPIAKGVTGGDSHAHYTGVVYGPGTYTISVDTTLSTDIHIISGAVFEIASGKTLTITGRMFAGRYKIFSGAGVVTFAAGAVSEVYPEWWVVNTTPGTTDMITAFDAAIAALPASGGTISLLGFYAISTVWTIGDGTSTTFSTLNSVRVIGSSIGAGSNDRPADPLTVPTAIKWIGASGGIMVTLAGPISGCSFKNIVLNCNELAKTGLNMVHPDKSTFKNIEVLNNRIYAYILTAYPGNTATNNGANNNYFENLYAESEITNCGGIIIGSNSTESGGILDVAQCTFIGLRLRFDNATTAAGIVLQYTDYMTFINTTVVVKAGGYPLVASCPASTNGTLFPNSITFLNAALMGGALINDVTWAGTAPILFLGFHTGDSETIPTYAQIEFMGITDTGAMFGKIKPPHMSSAAAGSIVLPTGFIFYNDTTGKLNLYDGVAVREITSS